MQCNPCGPYNMFTPAEHIRISMQIQKERQRAMRLYLCVASLVHTAPRPVVRLRAGQGLKALTDFISFTCADLFQGKEVVKRVFRPIKENLDGN